MRTVETAGDPGGRAEREARFTRLAAEVYEPLQRFAARRVDTADVDDVVSEALLVLWRRLDEVPADGALPWSYAVARNVIANQRRASARRSQLTVRLAGEPQPPVPGSDENAFEGLDAGLDPVFRSALERLGAKDREIVLLWAWEDLAPREIAVVLGTSANAVSLRLSRARRRLRTELAARRQDRGSAGQTTDASEGGRR